MTLAITRPVSSSIQACELTHLTREPIDLGIARAQHAAYLRRLADLGCRVLELPEEADLPDAVFVEDTAVILERVAVLMKPGARSRRPEVASVRALLERHLPLLQIEGPATLDGGDVLVVERDIYVGLSKRSEASAVRELGRITAPHGYTVQGVELRGCLHLKSAVCALDDRTLLVNPAWVDADRLGGRRVVEIDPREPFGANVVSVRGTAIYPSAFPRTRAKIEEAGFPVVTLDASELAKAEGGVTCCCLLIDDD